MNASPEIINRVAQSGLLTIDLEQFYPKNEPTTFDLKDFLFMGLILKEKEFRQALKEKDWSQYTNKNVAIVCTADAIVPYWAYMVVCGYLTGIAHYCFFGTEREMQTNLFLNALQTLDLEPYRNARVVVKGCSNKPVPPAVYVEITRLLKPLVKSLMYGEPCSTVPVFKQ